MMLLVWMDLGPVVVAGLFDGFSHEEIDRPERLLLQANRLYF